MENDSMIKEINKAISYFIQQRRGINTLAIAVNNTGMKNLQALDKSEIIHDASHINGIAVYHIPKMRHLCVVGEESVIKRMSENLNKVTISLDIKKDGFHD